RPGSTGTRCSRRRWTTSCAAWRGRRSRSVRSTTASGPWKCPWPRSGPSWKGVRSLSAERFDGAQRFDVQGRVVIVTGGAGMLGSHYAQALSEAGAHVVVADVDRDRAEKVVAGLTGARSLAVRADVSDPA